MNSQSVGTSIPNQGVRQWKPILNHLPLDLEMVVLRLNNYLWEQGQLLQQQVQTNTDSRTWAGSFAQHGLTTVPVISGHPNSPGMADTVLHCTVQASGQQKSLKLIMFLASSVLNMNENLPQKNLVFLCKLLSTKEKEWALTHTVLRPIAIKNENPLRCGMVPCFWDVRCCWAVNTPDQWSEYIVNIHLYPKVRTQVMIPCMLPTWITKNSFGKVLQSSSEKKLWKYKFWKHLLL